MSDYNVDSIVSVGGHQVQIVGISSEDPQVFFARPVNPVDPSRDYVSEYWDSDIDDVS